MTGDPRYAALRTALAREYRIEAIVSETADGAVYRGRDLVLERPVTIKAVHPAHGGPERTERFRREARTLAAVNHPCIPAVHHAGELDGFLHVVMDAPGDETLAALLARRALAPDEVVRLGVQVLGALEAMHAAGMAHREVVPEHVIAAEGRYVLDGFEAAGPAAGPADVAEDLAATRRLLTAAVGRPGRRLRATLERPWGSAAELRDALESFGDTRLPWRRIGLAAVCLVLALGLAYVWRETTAPAGPGGPPRELAVVPFEVDGAPPLDPLGTSLASLVQLNLDNLPGLEVTSARQVDRWWDAHGRDALGIDWAAAARGLRVHWVAHGIVDRRPDDQLRVRLTLYDSLGRPRVLSEVRGPASDLALLGDSLSLSIIRMVAPRADSLYTPVTGLAAVPLPALKAFLQGEAAFARDAWSLAQRYYEIALEHDSTFALAEWRLANVKHWRRLPYETDLRDVYQRHAGRFRQRDRLLIEALLEPDLRVRFPRLEAAMREHPRDAYARLLQGEELFHRGPLAGRGLDEAVKTLASAVAHDPSLALAYDHLVLAAVRMGDEAAAGEVLRRRRAAGTEVGPEDLNLLPFLELVVDERFAPARAWLRARVIAWRKDPRKLAGVERLARTGTPWLDMPKTQLRYSELLLRAGRRAAETHASAHEGMGLALFALGRPAGAVAHIDSAAALFDTPEARLQQAEWRVVPPVFGLPRVDERDWHGALEAMTTDDAVGGRAAWALALSAQSSGDTAAARRWMGRLPLGAPLRRLLEAREAALHGDPTLALAMTDAVSVDFLATRPPDAFAGAAFHLFRGDWLASLGDRARADQEWLWYEASDIEGWPTGSAQAGEVDAALGVFARLKRARGLLADGASAADTVRACSHLRRIGELWSEADGAMRPLVDQAATLAERCA